MLIINFDLLINIAAKNFTTIKNKRQMRKIICYYYSHLKIKKRKLKLGKIIFEYTNYDNPEFSFDSDFEVKFESNQEFIDEFVLFQESVKQHNWKWDAANIGALILLLSIFFLQLYCIISNWVYEHLDVFLKNRKKTNFINIHFYKFYLNENKIFLTSTIPLPNKEFTDFLALNLSRIKVL